MTINMSLLADGAYKGGASDIHLVSDNPIYVRVAGEMRRLKQADITAQDIEKLLKDIMPKESVEDLRVKRSTDFSWQADDRMRFRVTAYYERRKLRVVMRLIKTEIASLDDLGLPDVLKTISLWRRGLTLVTGATGSGKSTTLAAMINEINVNERRCLLTIEDPIEMMHPNKRAVISQREVGHDVPDFRSGLVQALRQDPDVILIGEMRDPETIKTALLAAETGHYVFSTMHTTNAINTVERIFSEFDEREHVLLREQLANSLRAIITQRLVPLAGGKGRIAALEIMVNNKVTAKLILEDKVASIETVMRQGTDGMMIFDQHLAEMVREEKIVEEEILEHCDDVYALKRYIEGTMTSTDRGGIVG